MDNSITFWERIRLMFKPTYVSFDRDGDQVTKLTIKVMDTVVYIVKQEIFKIYPAPPSGDQKEKA